MTFAHLIAKFKTSDNPVLDRWENIPTVSIKTDDSNHKLSMAQ